MRYPPSAMAGGGGGGGGSVALMARPTLATATVFDSAGLGTWSENAAGDLTFDATGFASATAQTTPAGASLLLWPAQTPDGTAITSFADILRGIDFFIGQSAGTPGAATNYALIAGIANAALTEYAFSGLDHAASVGRGCQRLVSLAYFTGAASRPGQLGCVEISRSGGGAVTVSSISAMGVEADGALLATTSAAPSQALRGTFATDPTGLRYFIGFLPRGSLASKPANARINFGFWASGLAQSVSS